MRYTHDKIEHLFGVVVSRLHRTNQDKTRYVLVYLHDTKSYTIEIRNSMGAIDYHPFGQFGRSAKEMWLALEMAQMLLWHIEATKIDKLLEVI